MTYTCRQDIEVEMDRFESTRDIALKVLTS